MKALAAKAAFAGLLFAATPFAASTAAADWVNPFAYPQPDSAPAEFMAVIEIPTGSFTKYEIDADNGTLFVDRYVSMPVFYPANYGSITSSAAADGDPLDVLVFTRDPVAPGALIKARAIGILQMVDDGEQDDKIVAVPASDIDPTYDEVQSVEDLPAMDRARMEQFFAVYKNLPEGGDAIELNGFLGVDEAQAAVTEALDAYTNR